MTWDTCSQAGWGAGGSPGTRTSSNWLASKVICPCFLAASRTAKPAYTDWLNTLVHRPHERELQLSIDDWNKCVYGTRPVSAHPLGAISVSC